MTAMRQCKHGHQVDGCWACEIDLLKYKLKVATKALEFAKHRCEDIAGDPSFGESDETIRKQDIEWASLVVSKVNQVLEEVNDRTV
jgi:hypothetical protein